MLIARYREKKTIMLPGTNTFNIIYKLSIFFQIGSRTGTPFSKFFSLVANTRSPVIKFFCFIPKGRHSPLPRPYQHCNKQFSFQDIGADLFEIPAG